MREGEGRGERREGRGERREGRGERGEGRGERGEERGERGEGRGEENRGEGRGEGRGEPTYDKSEVDPSEQGPFVREISFRLHAYIAHKRSFTLNMCK
jgi:hypothetical protein